MRLLLVALLVVAAGCVSHDADPQAPTPSEAAPEVAPVVLASRLPDEAPRPALHAEVALTQAWLKPLEAVEASLTAPAGTTVSWYSAIRGVQSHVLALSNGTYVVADHAHRALRLPATGDLAPGASGVLRFDEAGRATVESRHAPGARLVVDVRQDAPAQAGRVFLLAEDGGLRFVPGEVAVRPGAALAVENQGNATADAATTGFLLRLPQRTPLLSFTPVDEGLYDLLAVVDGPSGARGEARARFLVDFDRPVARERVGPYEDTFTWPSVPGVSGSARSYPLEAAHPIRSLRLHVHVESQAPMPASVALKLVRGSLEVARTTSADEGALSLADLPAGDYRVVVEPLEGAFVAYRVEGEARYVLPLPPALAGG